MEEAPTAGTPSDVASGAAALRDQLTSMLPPGSPVPPVTHVGDSSHAFSHVKHAILVYTATLPAGAVASLRPPPGMEVRSVLPSGFEGLGLTTWTVKALHPVLKQQTGVARGGDWLKARWGKAGLSV